MARHFTVTLTSGTNVGPYDIYYDQIDNNNFAKLYGTNNNADNLTLAQVQGGVLVTVPDGASTVLLYNNNTVFATDCPTTTITYNIPGQVTPTPTATNVPPTPVPTSTATPVPTSTATPVPTSTATPVPPTATPVPPTATPVPPTATPTPTPTPGPTAIPPTATPTAVPPTATPTAVPPTATPTAVPPTATPTAVACTEYIITYPSNASNPTGTWTFTCCDGSSGSVTLGRDQDGIICVQDGTSISTPQGGISPQQIGSCTSGCGDGAQPTPTPTATVAQPTPTPVGQCEFVFIPDQPSFDTSRYGIRWNNPQSGIQNSTFDSMLGAPAQYGGQSGVAFGVCSTMLPVGWDSFDNTLQILDGMVNLESGGSCQSDLSCVYEGPSTPTPTPVPPTPTPTPEVVASCIEYSYDDSGSLGDPDRTITYNDCDGNPQSFSFPAGGYGVFCGAQGNITFSPTTNIYIEGDCPGGTAASPTSTPAPTATRQSVQSSTYYISSAQFTLSDFCDTNQSASTLITSSASSINLLLGTTVYDFRGDPFVGNSSRYYFVSETQNAGSNTSIGPQYIVINPFGEVEDVGQIDCSGGGGNPLNEEVGPTPTPNE